MKLLVTGNNGYIGTVMVPMLLTNGFDVSGLDSNLFEGSIFGDKTVTGGIADIPYLRKDIRDINKSDLDGVDAVVHLCALSNDPLGNFNPAITYDINHKASVRLAKLAKKVGVEKFVFASSCSVYGASKADLLTEGSEVNPITAYAKSKIRAETDIAKLANTNFCPTFLRSSTAYGLSPMLRFDLVVNNFVAWAYTKGKVLLKSLGNAWRPFVHIEDISRAFIAVLNAPSDIVNNQVFNVGQNEENYRIQEIAEIVKKTVPNSEIEFAEGAEPDTRSYNVKFDKISQTLPEFKPKWNVKSGAQQLYDAYKKVDLCVEEFEGPRYRRITNLENSVKTGRLDQNLRYLNNRTL